MRCVVGPGANAIVHYFNSFHGVWIDSTAAQFKSQSPRRKFKKNPPEDTYIFPPKPPNILGTWDRVEILEQRVLEQVRLYG